jgi:hypothetical protein
MFHKIKLKATNEQILINLRNVIRVSRNGKEICYETNVVDGGGSFILFNFDPKKYSVACDSVEEAKKEFEEISKKFELK